ncbi:MAG: transmembrane 220 family protein [Pseudomonadota bacterium]
MLLLFLLSAFVQLNDPDPFRWTMLYLLAASTCVVDRSSKIWIHRVRLVILYGLIIVTVAGIAMLLDDLISGLNKLSDGTPLTMATLSEERGREAGGLLIIGLWCAVLLLVRLFRQSGPAKQVTLEPALQQEKNSE